MTLTQQGRFRLGGRLGDMVSVAGKRTNLAALNAILADVDELRDGVVVHIPATDGDRIVVVAVLDPASGAAEAVARDAIRREFRNHVDAVFLPKRIGFVAKLPRSPTGKIPANAIPALLKDAAIDV
jgi:acyl-coenzyme A synthetase/AMP-(fatty) acid ligase